MKDPEQILRDSSRDDRWHPFAIAPVERPQPRRRLGLELGVGAAIVLVAIGSVFAVNSWRAVTPPTGQISPTRPTATAIPSPPPTHAGSYLTSDEASTAWTALTADYPEPLAPGYNWPLVYPARGNGLGAEERGLVDSVAALYWVCTWEKTAIEAHRANDVATSDDALQNVIRYESFPATKEFFVDLKVWRKTVVEPALEGDFTGMQYDASTCKKG